MSHVKRCMDGSGSVACASSEEGGGREKGGRGSDRKERGDGEQRLGERDRERGEGRGGEEERPTTILTFVFSGYVG